MLLKLLVAIIIIAGVALGAVFIRDYLSQTAEADALQEQIQNTGKTASSVAAATRSLEEEQSDIARRSSEAQAAIDAAKDSLPARTNSNAVVRRVLSTGQEYGVTVIPLTTDEWTRQRINKHDYSVFRLTINVRGTPENVVQFVRQLQDNLYPTLIIESMSSLKSTESAPEETPAPTAAGAVTVAADLRLAIYAK